MQYITTCESSNGQKQFPPIYSAIKINIQRSRCTLSSGLRGGAEGHEAQSASTSLDLYFSVSGGAVQFQWGLQRPTTAYNADYGLQRPATAYNGPQQPTTAYNADYGLQRPTTAYNGRLRPTTAYNGLQRPTTADCGLQRPTAAYYGLQRCREAHSGKDTYPAT